MHATFSCEKYWNKHCMNCRKIYGSLSGSIIAHIHDKDYFCLNSHGSDC